MIAIYDKETGRVNRFNWVPREEYDLNVKEGESCIEVDFAPPGNFIVIDGQLIQIDSP